MRALLILAVAFVICFPVTSQNNQTITAVPFLEVTDIRLADENGNLTIEANESCNLLFSLKNSGEQPAHTVKVKLILVDPTDLNVKYRKSRNISIVKPNSSQELKFPIDAGEYIKTGIANFTIEVSELNGFDATPASLEIKTSPGGIHKKASAGQKTADMDQNEDPSHFGLAGLKYIDSNDNDYLEAFETSHIQVRIFNNANRHIDNVTLYLEPNEGSISGFGYPRGTGLGTFSASEYRDISLPIKGRKSITDGQITFSVYLIEEGGIASVPQLIQVFTRNYEVPELIIANAEFSGLGGKPLKQNEPFILKVTLENTGTSSAFEIDVSPKLTNTNVKLLQTKPVTFIEEIPGGQSKELEFQFITNKKNIFPDIPVILEVTENFNDLYIDSVLSASIILPEKKTLAKTDPVNRVPDQVPENPLSEEAKAPVVTKSPPNLVLTNIEFIDENKNDVINHKEACEIKFIISNTGAGSAEDIAVLIKQLNNNIKGLSFQERITLGDLGPNQEVPVAIPVRSTGILISEVADFRIEVVESSGWDAVPQSLTVETQKLLEPNLSIASASFNGQSGQLRPNDDIELKVTLKNNGPGIASDVKVQFELPNDPNFFLRGDGKDEFDIESLKSGESTSISLEFITNRRYTEKQIPIKVDISESYRKYGLDTIFVGEMFEEALASAKHEIQPRIINQPNTTPLQDLNERQQIGDQAGEAINSDLIPEENPGVAVRGGGDPLKGLGYEEAVRDMNIGRYFALIIGIDNYQGAWPSLKNAVNDAESVEIMLKSKYKFDHYETLYNEMATAKNILNKLAWLIENVTEEDNLLIFYSGHGEFNTLLNRGYWVPADAKTTETVDLISNSEIQDYLQAIKSKHTLLISDACFSGDIFRGETLTVPLVRSERYYRQQHAKPSRRAITSGGIEPVVDSGPEGHSVFSFYLLESLEANQDRFFDASQLFTELKVPVFNNSNQSPIFLPIKDTGDRGGQFIFIRK